ncbi:MAG: 30S ribosome-binding factor RbfA [Candidatus Binatia bacterium]|nr:30S ribosome-binding factor RbfA [Candidatus Binatia bacterium]
MSAELEGHMSGRRAERVGETLREALAEVILREIKDPRVGSVSITSVRVSADLGTAWVRFRCLGDEASQQRCLAGLRSAQGFLRAQLLRRLDLRRAPQLVFEVDSTLPEIERLARALRDVTSEN